jgi:ADP-heptose:LPS heptosyltransferase
MEELKAQKFQISIVLQSTLKLAAALYGVGVPNRIGPLSKLHSFFFYNRGTRQRRSLVEMHEADYNLQLLRKLGIRVGTQTLPTRIAVPAEQTEWAKNWLDQKGYLPDPNLREHLVAVHPGMGGSALNWPENYYVELIRALDREGHRILITGGIAEASLLERLEDSLKGTEKPILFYLAEPGTGVDRLAALYQSASIVVAPSTGPLHVAVALGKPVLTFYPPIRVQSAIRWGPYVKNFDDAAVLVPEAYCGEDFSCRGPKCNYYPCMRSILPKQVLEEATRLLSDAGVKRAQDLNADRSSQSQPSTQK